MSNAITDLAEQTTIWDSDLLVVLQHDKYVSSKYDTCALSGQSLFSVLIEKTLDMQKLQNTAYMVSTDFSPSEHNHNELYNKLDFEFQYASQNTYQRLSSHFSFINVVDDGDVVSVGNVFIDGTLVPVEVPVSSVTDVKKITFNVVEPMVGTLKFVASSSIKTNSSIQYRSDDFDGWLYPDGTTFYLSDFVLSSQLKTLYGNSDNTTFTLPVINNFLKMNGTNQKISSSAIGAGEKSNVLVKHSHSMDVKCTSTANIKLRLPGNPNAGNGGTIHRGDGDVAVIIVHNGSHINYNGGKCNFNELADSLGLSYNKILNRYQMRIDDACRAFQAIDAGNGTNLYSTFIAQNTMQLNPVDRIDITASMYMTGQPNISYAGSNDGETVPSHVILPVMIYVGQRRRDIL